MEPAGDQLSLSVFFPSVSKKANGCLFPKMLLFLYKLFGFNQLTVPESTPDCSDAFHPCLTQ